MNTSLAGSLRVMPGRPVPNLARQRPQGLSRLWRGQPASALPGLLGALFTLCGHAHRLVSQQAIAAARGEAPGLSAADRRGLQWHTAREHARRVTLDWADLAGQPEAPALEVLRASPLQGAALDTRGLTAWLQHEVLGLAAAPWLARMAAHGEAALAEWCDQAATPTARALRVGRAALGGLSISGPSLNLRDDAGAPQRLADHLRGASAEAFTAAPHTAQGSADTGAWSRAADPQRGSPQNAWMRLASRLVDLVRLSAPQGGAQWLDSGACPTGAGEGLAWIETARGLLVHWVRLDGERVEACQVLSPTDWNFHPSGGLAQALSTTPSVPAAQWLVAAFDPCVAHRLVTAPETADA